MVDFHNVTSIASLWKTRAGQKRKNVANEFGIKPDLPKDGHRALSRSRSDPMSNLIFLKRERDPNAHRRRYVDPLEVQDSLGPAGDRSGLKGVAGAPSVDVSGQQHRSKDLSASLDCLTDLSEYVQLRRTSATDFASRSEKVTVPQNRPPDESPATRTVILSQPKAVLPPVRHNVRRRDGRSTSIPPASSDDTCGTKRNDVKSSLSKNDGSSISGLDVANANVSQSKAVDGSLQCTAFGRTSGASDRRESVLFRSGVSSEDCCDRPCGHREPSHLTFQTLRVPDEKLEVEYQNADPPPPVERRLKPKRFTSVEVDPNAPPVPPRYSRSHSVANNPLRHVDKEFDHVARSKTLVAQHFVEARGLNVERRMQRPAACLKESSFDEVDLFWPNPHAVIDEGEVTGRAITQQPTPGWLPSQPFVRSETCPPTVAIRNKDDSRREPPHNAFCSSEPEVNSCLKCTSCLKSTINVMTCMWCLRAACYHFVTKDDVGYNDAFVRDTICCAGSAGQSLKRVAIALACVPCMPCLSCYPILWGCTKLCDGAHSKDTP